MMCCKVSFLIELFFGLLIKDFIFQIGKMFTALKNLDPEEQTVVSWFTKNKMIVIF